jgi:glycosyltransferase involved in cell wall biosynthesis
MSLNNLLTIVIPCKNESKIISKTLDLLNYQEGIENVEVIICDSSTDDTRNIIKSRIGDKFRKYVLDGGLPSVARNKGASLAMTDYILFLDADIFLLNPKTIKVCLDEMIKNDRHLTTIKFESETTEHNLKFRFFTLFQKVVSKFSPFALGGFMMFQTKKFFNLGWFNENVKVGEDYLLSRLVKPKKFKVCNILAFTTPRRYQKKSVWYMLKLVVMSYINRNNINYFSSDHDYWK